jgi:hypothetical protein
MLHTCPLLEKMVSESSLSETPGLYIKTGAVLGSQTLSNPVPVAFHDGTPTGGLRGCTTYSLWRIFTNGIGLKCVPYLERSVFLRLMLEISGLQLYLCVQGLCSFYRMPLSRRKGRRFYVGIMVLTLLATSLVFAADTITKTALLTGGRGISLDYGGPAPVWSNLMYFFGVGVIHVAGDGLLVSLQSRSCVT